jgi:hypothetical protein
MLAKVTSPVLAVVTVLLGFALLGTANTGCLDAAEGGTSGSGGSSSTDAGEGGTQAAADAGLVWGCADNGTQCNCYSPAPSEFTQTGCIQYACCVATVSNGLHGCQCTNDSVCSSTDTSAVRVAACP